MKLFLLFLLAFASDIAAAAAPLGPGCVQLLTAALGSASAKSSDAPPIGMGKWLDVSSYRTGSLHVVATGIDHIDGTVTLEQSSRPDPTVGTPPAALFTTTLTSAAEFYLPVDTNKLTGRWVRAVYTKVSNTAGTVDVYGCFK